MQWFRESIPAWLLVVLVIGAVVGTASAFLLYTIGPLAPDFTMTTSSSPQTVLAQGSPSSNRMIQVAAVNSFTGIVSMTVSSPTVISARLIQSGTVNIIPEGQVLLGHDQSLNLTIGASLSGNYSVVVTGTSGRLTHSVTVKIIARGLSFNVNPDPVAVTPCYSGPCYGTSATVAVTSQNGLGGNMTLFYISIDSGVGASGPNGVIVGAGGTATFTITAFLTPTLPPPTPPHGGSVTLAVGTPLGPTSFIVNIVPA